ncbi:MULTISPECIES: Pr6Pr family membrane protein [unclassified Nocardia]|uniref:Pr6Pr family membrane protein n=1 Tax=unclassified Nocardia TaxID=2637762 RepID=UPI0035DEF933
MNTTAGTPLWIRGLRFAFGVLTLVALLDGPLRNIHTAGYSYANYFSYFTIQSNLLAMVVLLVGAVRDPGDRRWQLLRCGAVLYMVITGIIYALLLSNIDVQMEGQWTNSVLHRIIPIVMLADWLLVVAPAVKLTVRMIGGLLIYPLLYGVYTLIRGAIVDWYPYPFIDPRGPGYLELAGKLVLLAIVFAFLAASVLALNGMVARFWRESRTHIS